MGISERTATTAGRVEGAVALDLRVTESHAVTTWLRELRVEGDLTGFAPWPGQDLMVSVPPGDDSPRWRRYTVRRFDQAAGWIDLWIATECDGPGARWAIDARPGDAVEAVGPRGKIALDDAATGHLFIVDGAGLSAMCAMAEGLDRPSTVSALVVLASDVDTEAVGALLPVCSEDVELGSNVSGPCDPTWLAQVIRIQAAALRDEFAIEQSAAYVFGELSFTRDASAALALAGYGPERIASKAYWRKDRSNEMNGEPDRANPSS